MRDRPRRQARAQRRLQERVHLLGSQRREWHAADRRDDVPRDVALVLRSCRLADGHVRDPTCEERADRLSGAPNDCACALAAAHRVELGLHAGACLRVERAALAAPVLVYADRDLRFP